MCGTHLKILKFYTHTHTHSWGISTYIRKDKTQYSFFKNPEPKRFYFQCPSNPLVWPYFKQFPGPHKPLLSKAQFRHILAKSSQCKHKEQGDKWKWPCPLSMTGMGGTNWASPNPHLLSRRTLPLSWSTSIVHASTVDCEGGSPL